MAGLVASNTCGKEVSGTAPACPHCGESLPGLHISCPQYKSSNTSIGQKGFGLGKAAAGGLLLGPLGLLGGMIGRKKPEFLCQSCGHKWEASAADLS